MAVARSGAKRAFGKRVGERVEFRAIAEDAELVARDAGFERKAVEERGRTGRKAAETRAEASETQGECGERAAHPALRDYQHCHTVSLGRAGEPKRGAFGKRVTHRAEIDYDEAESSGFEDHLGGLERGAPRRSDTAATGEIRFMASEFGAVRVEGGGRASVARKRGADTVGAAAEARPEDSVQVGAGGLDAGRVEGAWQIEPCGDLAAAGRGSGEGGGDSGLAGACGSDDFAYSAAGDSAIEDCVERGEAGGEPAVLAGKFTTFENASKFKRLRSFRRAR